MITSNNGSARYIDYEDLESGADIYALSESDIQSVRDAHSAGITGQGVIIDTDDSRHCALAFAPGISRCLESDINTYTELSRDGIEVNVGKNFNIADDNNIAIGDEIHDPAPGTILTTKYVVGTTALLMHKFDTLNGDEIEDIIIGTRNTDNTLNITKALSPVGNLRVRP